MRPKSVFIAVVVLAVLALLLRQVTQAVHHTFSGRPGIAQLARATPAYQNGLTLMEIVNVSPNRSYSYSDKGPQDLSGAPNPTTSDTGLWIKLPPNAIQPSSCADSRYNGCRDALAVSARTSAGHAFPLEWRTAIVANGGGGLSYLLAIVPAGYPNTVRWVDVMVDDKHGNVATWRILHLPPMQHVLAPPVTPQTTFHQGNITVTARTYRGTDPNGNGYGPMILCDLTGTITNAPNSWELGPLSLTREWETPGYVAPSGGSTLGTSKDDKSKVTIQATRQAVYYNHPEPYLSATHWVRLGARLQEFATYDETVVFHNLSVITYGGSDGLYLAGAQPQTVTSPSGVTVTLVDVQHQKQLGYSRAGGCINLLIRYPQSNNFPSLPRSPLWRRHNGLIHVTVDVPKPYESYGYGGSDQEGTSSFRSDKPLPKTFASFPIIIRQRVNLRAVPMTFTLPVLDKERT